MLVQRAVCWCVLAVALATAGPARAGRMIHVTYDAAHLDLAKHVLQFQVSRPISQAELKVIGDDGSTLDQSSQIFSDAGAQPGKWIAMPWKQASGTTVLELELRVVGTDRSATKVTLIPWSVTIAHEDVNFATDSAAIEPGEQAKLDASLAKIDDVVKRSSKFIKMQLYVAGHTDTVGPSAKNRTLSLARARAIAAYFRKKGLALPIAYAGFGEDVPKVVTPDNTDERANRRADYVLGPAGAAPPFGGAYLKAHAAWRRLP